MLLSWAPISQLLSDMSTMIYLILEMAESRSVTIGHCHHVSSLENKDKLAIEAKFMTNKERDEHKQRKTKKIVGE